MVTWRDAVRVELARYRTRTGESVFTLQDVYEQALERLRTQFPDNNHPEAKLRQVLQQLRDRGEIEFADGNGRYRLSSLDLSGVNDAEFERIAAAKPETDSGAAPDVPVENVPVDFPEGETTPERVRRVVEAISRNRELADRLKERYDHRCQLCGTRRRRTRAEGYSEAHHIEPLGEPHSGPDIAENLLVVCPNHHRDMDYGLIRIDPKTHELRHVYDDSVGDTLRVREWHDIGPEFLRYHNERIADF